MGQGKDNVPDDENPDRANGHSIHTGNIEGVGIAIGTGASVRIYGDIHYYPIQLHAPLRKVFDPLIANRTAIFGGRDSAFEQIGRFIHNNAGGYLVITAPAGFGKTALMAALISRTPEAFAYHFFTSLYGETSLSELDFLKNVVEQMAEWHGYKELLPGGLQDLRALYWRFIEEPLNRTQVLVLDGLDEVESWKISPYLTRSLPQNLHFILTVRDVGQNWAAEFKLPKEQIDHLPLIGLERNDIVRVMRAAGEHAAQMVQDPEFVSEVMQVASYQGDQLLGADPFYVRLLVEDIVAGGITKENIAAQPKGLDEYLDRWWQGVKGKAGETPVKDLLGSLTAALGSIQRKELEEINPSLTDDWYTDFFEEILSSVRRYVMGNEKQGYSLAHPRLRQYMLRRIRIGAYQDKILDYCARWNENKSEYALAHYAEHLANAGQKDALYALISKPWMDAKFQESYSHQSFAKDVDLMIKMAQSEQTPNLLQIGRGTLIYATLGELATNVPLELFGLLVQLGYESIAIEHAVLIQNSERKSQAYLKIGEAVFAKGMEKEFVKKVLRKALATTEAISEEMSKEKVLSEIAGLMGKLGDQEGLTLILAIAESFKNQWSKARVLCSAANALAQVSDEEGLNRILAAAHSVNEASAKAPILLGLIDSFIMMKDKVGIRRVFEVGESYTRVLINVAAAQAKLNDLVGLKQTVLAANAIQDKQNKAQAQSGVAVAVALAQPGNQKALGLALSTAEAIWDERAKVRALSDLAGAQAQLGEAGLAIQTVRLALSAADAISWDEDKTEALSVVVGMMAKINDREGLDLALTATKAILLEVHKANALCTITKAMAVLIDIEGLKRALVVTANDFKDEKDKANALIGVAEALSKVGNQTDLKPAMEITRTFRAYWHKVTALHGLALALAQVGDRDGVLSILETSKTIQDETYRIFLMSGLAQAFANLGEDRMAIEIAQSVLATSVLIRNEHLHAKVMCVIAQTLSTMNETALADKIVLNVLAAIKTLQDQWGKAEVLNYVINVLAQSRDSEGVEHALKAIETLYDDGSIAMALVGAARALAHSGDLDKLDFVFDEVDNIYDELAKANVLIGMAGVLAESGDKEGLLRVLELAETFQKNAHHTEALSGVAIGLARIGEMPLAILTSQHALAAVESISTEEDMASELSGVAEAFAQVKDKEGLKRVLDLAETIQVEEDKARALTGLAAALAYVNDRAGLKRIQATAENMLRTENKARVLSELAAALAQIGDSLLAGQTAFSALTAAEAYDVEEFKGYFICDIAEALTRVGNHEVLKRTLASVKSLHSEWFKADALAKIALTLAQMDDLDGLMRTIEIAETIQGEAEKPKALSQIAMALTQVGKEKESIQALSTAFEAARFSGREAVLGVFQCAIDVVSRIGKSSTIIELQKAIEGVDEWLGSKSQQPA